MEYLIGAVRGVVVGVFARLSGFDRDRAFYPTVMIVIASYYSLFAVMGASRDSTLGMEIAIGLVFSVSAVLGFKKNMWLVAAAIAGHGVFDFFVHHALVTNPGMPVWWPGFCGTIDIVLGGWLAICLWCRSSDFQENLSTIHPVQDDPKDQDHAQPINQRPKDRSYACQQPSQMSLQCLVEELPHGPTHDVNGN
jgi:hypothetical protein